MLKMQKVPGIGPVLSTRLFMWRDSIAMTFVPTQTMPASEKNRVATRFAPVLLPLAQTVQRAIQDLEAIIRSHRSSEDELCRTIGKAVQEAANAQAHLEALANLP